MNTNLINYYEAFEKVLLGAREISEDYRTHFGIMDKPEDDYCWFSAIADSDNHPVMLANVVASMNKLHVLLFHKDLQHKKILDVGCGTAGTLKKIALENPDSLVSGININPVQIDIAKDHVKNVSNTNVVEGDFFNYPFTEKFDLLYFIESAFHMENKSKLVERISSLLNTNGEVYLVDIFYSEQLWSKVRNKKSEENIFEYLSVSEWKRLFVEFDIHLTSYTDVSSSVSNHLQIKMSEKEYKDTILTPLFAPYENHEDLKENMVHAFLGYKRLSNLFKKGMLEYGVLKLKRK